MTKTIQKNMLVLGGLFFLSQTLIVPAAQASAFTIEQSTYQHAATSADPIVFNHHLSFGDSAVKVMESVNHLISLNILTDQSDNTVVSKVEDTPEPTPEDIKSYVLAEIKKAGLNIREAEAIIRCESRWDEQAKGNNRNGSYDLGLWQINSIHKNISDTDKLDYKASTKWAIAKRLNDGNWSAWSCSRKIGKTQPAKELAAAPAVDYNW